MKRASVSEVYTCLSFTLIPLLIDMKGEIRGRDHQITNKDIILQIPSPRTSASLQKAQARHLLAICLELLECFEEKVL